MRKRSLAVMFLLLASAGFVGISVTPSASASTHYVGGAGPGNYTSIQEAIYAARAGDTVFAFNGTYHERVSVSKRISLIGEDVTTTIIDRDPGGIEPIVQVTASSVTISGFTLTFTIGDGDFPWAGMELLNVKDCRISHVYIKEGQFNLNNDRGLVLSDSDNNTLTNVTISKSRIGIEYQGSHGNKFVDSSISWTHHSADISYSHNNVFVNNDFSHDANWGVTLGSSTNATFINNRFSNNGVLVGDTSHNIDTSNTVNGKPIRYWKNIAGGKVPPEAGQVILVNCTDVIVENQNMSHTTGGIQISQSSNITIANNTASFSGMGIALWDSHRNLIINNTVHDCNGSELWYGIVLSGSRNNTLMGNRISKNGWSGVSLYQHSNGNVISRNKFALNQGAVEIQYSYSNLIVNNTFSRNGYAILSGSSHDNLIYHNSFLRNKVWEMWDSDELWDNGYPAGGNYWSDYTGVDHYSGPNQDQPGSDGLGDTPYLIEYDAQDNYPLMAPPNRWNEMLYGPVQGVATPAWSPPPDVPLLNGSGSLGRVGTEAIWTVSSA